MGKVDEKKQIKEQNILNTAFRLFMTQGVSKTSISDIVENAGVAKGTFYLYFRDKYDLRDALVAHKAEQAIRHALDNSGYEKFQKSSDKIIAIADDVLEQMRREPMLLKFINKNLSWGIFRRTMDDKNSECFEQLKGVLDEEIDGFEVMLYQIIELVSASCQSVILESTPMDLDSYKPYLFASICAIVDSFRPHSAAAE